MSPNSNAPQSLDIKKLEVQTQAKVTQLETQLKSLENEIKIINGKLKNRSVSRISELEPENQKLREELKQQQRILLGVLIDNFRPNQASDEKIQFENYKLGTLEYMKKLEIEPDLWKNIES